MALQWFVQEGWVVVLSVLNLALALFMFLGYWRQNRRVMAIELRHRGVTERITGVAQKVDTVQRQVTGQLEISNEEATKLKKASKKVKDKEDFDDI